MNKPFASLLFAACLWTIGASPVSAQVENVTEVEETTLAVIEAPLSRESLNEIRIELADQGVKFNYGNFNFHPASGDLVGVEIFLVVDGTEYREFFMFTSEDCVLRILKESGFRMEGC